MDDLVGRDTEFAAIGAALRRPDLAGALLVGDAGVGKSHLLAAAVRHAASLGFAVVSVSGTRALCDIPLAAFASLLPGRPVGDAGDLVQIRRALAASAGSRPLLLGLDDAHLLDEASAALAHQLAADLTAFVVGTIRHGEAPPEAITALVKDGLAVRIPVEALSAEHLAEFAQLTLGAPVSSRVADQVFARTLGNPLFARELLFEARSAGTLREHGGTYDADVDLPSPSTLTQFVDARLATLGDAHRRALALLGIGGPLEVDLLESLVEPEVLVELEAARLLTADDHDGGLVVTFVHPVYADAARRAVGGLDARHLLGELADALERRRPHRPQDVLRIASWRVDGGSPADSLLLADATRIAASRHDHALAERLGRAWFDLVADRPEGLRAALRLAGAHIEQGEFHEAIDVLADPRVRRELASPADRIRGAVIESNVRFWAFGDVVPATAILDRAIAESGGSNPLLDAAGAAIWAAAGEPARAMALAPPGSDAARLPAGIATDLLASTTAGRPQAALDRLGARLDVRHVAGGAITEAAAAFALVAAGRVREAEEMALDGWEHAIRTSDRHGQVSWAITLGWIALEQGTRIASEQWFERSVELARGSAASVHGTRWGLGGLLLARAQGTDLGAAHDVAAQLASMPPHGARAHADFEHRGQAWLRAMSGDVDGAIADLIAHADEAATHGRTAPRVWMLVDVARLEQPSLAWHHLQRLPIEVDGDLFPLVVDAVRGLAMRDAPSLSRIAERLAELGYLARGAELAAAAWSAAQHAVADARTVAQLGRRAHELRERIDLHAAPAFDRATPAISLSRREREIAELVAAGRSSREVADELIIGVRTVESHLARIYAKLGVRSRGELADAVGLLGAGSGGAW